MVVFAETVSLFVAAFFIGVFSSLLGIGGGGLMVPLLVLGGFVSETKFAVGTSISAVAFTSLSSSVGYLRNGAVDLRLGLLIAPMTVVGGYAGAVASDVLPESVLATSFGVFMFYPGIKMALDSDVSATVDVEGRYGSILVFVFGGVVGFSSGLFGIGGGSLMVPVLTMLLGLTITRAVATSLFAMFPSAVVASYKQYGQGNLIPELALPLIAGITVGAGVGPHVSAYVPDESLKRGFGVLLLFIGVRMVTRGLS
ncbi:MAG: sulfite exporter TauE/SafE family protein [Halobacteria archaeon]|nr:sulfite exporter TauE/SafE family protein [Halobacteria archaeon]